MRAIHPLRLLRLSGICLAFCASVIFLAGCQAHGKSRKNVLKIYNWADYIDEDLLKEFSIVALFLVTD